MLTYSEELLQEYSWSFWSTCYSVHGSVTKEHHFFLAYWRLLVKGCVLMEIVSIAIKMSLFQAALFSEWQVCEKCKSKQQQLSLVIQRKQFLKELRCLTSLKDDISWNSKLDFREVHHRPNLSWLYHVKCWTSTNSVCWLKFVKKHVEGSFHCGKLCRMRRCLSEPSNLM